jgi:DNA-binding NarL/FixJ family response regulator
LPRAPSRARGTDPNAATGGHVKARPITERQLEVLRIVARGRTNREIGLVLGISERTVRNHMREILRRLSTRDRTHSVVVAIGSGWIAIPVEPDDSAAMPVGTPSTAEVPSGS